MISADDFYKLVFEVPDLSVLTAFAREVPSARGENFCENADALLAVFSDQKSDDSLTEVTVASSALGNSSSTVVSGQHVDAPQKTASDFFRAAASSTSAPQPIAANTAGAQTADASQKVVAAALKPSFVIPGGGSEGGEVGKVPPAGASAAAVPAPIGALKSKPVTTASAAPTPAAAQTSPKEGVFVWGDFGAFEDHSGVGSSQSGTYQRRQSRGFPASQNADDQLESFGDFAYFVPKSEPTVNKLEGSFNRSMVHSRRSSILAHKMLDELEESPDEEDQDSGDNESATFSFGDFSLSTSGSDEDEVLGSGRSASSARNTISDETFMFGDFQVEMPDAGYQTKSTKPSSAASSRASSSAQLVPQPPSGVGSSPVGRFSAARSAAYGTAPNRIIRRPAIPHGSLLKFIDVQLMQGHSSRVRGAVFGAAAENCVISCGGEHLAVFRSAEGCHPLSMYFGHQDTILHITVSYDLTLIATSGADNLLSIFEVSTSKRVGDCSHNSAVLCATFSKNGKYVVSGAQDAVCRLWASKKKNQTTPMSNYFGHKSLITCVSFQSNGELVASGAGDAKLHIWSASSAKATHVLAKLHTNAIMCVAFNADGAFVMSSDANRVALTDVKTGALLASLEAVAVKPSVYNYFFTGFAFAPQQDFPNYFFVSGSDRLVTLYEFTVVPASSDGATSPTVNVSPLTNGQKVVPPLKGSRPGDNKTQSPAALAGPSVMVTISPEIWSLETRHRVTLMSTGVKRAMLLGDGGGNLILLNLQQRAPELLPHVRRPKPQSRSKKNS